MIVITVQSYNGQPLSGLAASFDELGGTIGRAETNQLVLSDAERTVSRVHAEVVYRRGSHALIDRGSNPVLVNGRPLGAGHEAPLSDGDQLTIGGYVLGVALAGKTSARDPFADLFDAPAAQASAPAPLQAQVRPPARAPAAAPPPWPAQPTPKRPVDPSTANTVPALPQDWDPFAAAPTAPSTSAPDPFKSMVPGSAESLLAPGPVAPSASAASLDSLFGLDGTSAATDPVARSPLAAPLAQSNTSTDADPLRALGQAVQGAPAPWVDAGSDMNTPWGRGVLRDSGAAAPAASPVATPPPAPEAPPGAVLSWQQANREVKVITLPGEARGGAAAPPASNPPPGTLTMILGKAGGASGTSLSAPPPASPTTMPPTVMPSVTMPAAILPAAANPEAPAPLPPPPASVDANATTAAAPTPPNATPPTAPAAPDALLQALAEGLGLPAQKLRTLDAAQMRLIGTLLRESTDGTVALLLARAALKRELRTDQTMIAARENNPLKFSPSVEMALLQLLGDPMPGFMPPDAALRDAFDDLRAHQVGMMGGLRAALDGLLQRFEPTRLEAQIARRGGLARMLPGSRKAQLWEQFQALYQQLSTEAAEDFHAAFGEAFRRAYEAHIEQIRRGE